jgi:hypothetical protein
MKKFWATCLIFFASNTASAETIPVILGKSDTFVRFVATIPENAEWIAQEQSSSITITLPPTLQFDVKEILGQAINNDVITTMTQQQGNEITIEFDCVCRGSAYVYRDIFLVVDIQSVSPQPIPNPTFSSQTLLSGQWWRKQLNAEVSLEPLKHTIMEIQPHAEVLVPERLARELATVTLAGRTELRTLASAELQQPPIAEEPSQDATSRQFELNIGMAASTDDGNRSPIEGTSCEAYRTKRLFSPNAGNFDYSEILSNRSTAYSQTGKPENQRLVDLSVDYLILGLSIEAEQALLKIGLETIEISLIREIAKVVDGRAIDSEFWAPFRNCRNSLYFWYAVQGEKPAPSTLDSDTLILHFKSMSPWLQHQIADRLHNVLADQADTSAAEELAAYTNLTHLPAEINEGQENTIKPEVTAIRLANRDQPEEMIDILSSGEIVEAVKISEAIRFEHKETPLWSELLEGEISAELAAGRYSSALRKIEEMVDEEIPPIDAERISSQAFLEVAAKANNTDFLALYLQKDNWPLNSEANDALALRIATFDLPGIVSSTSNEIPLTNETPGEGILIDEDVSLADDPQVFDVLNSAAIRDLLTDTQNLRSSVLEQLSPLPQ